MSEGERQGGHCDLCHAPLQIGETVYVHGTPSTGTEEEAKADKSVAWFEDPHWGICEGCHRRVLALDAGQLTLEQWGIVQTKRSLRNQDASMSPEEQFVTRRMQVEYTMRVLVTFARHHVPEWYSEVNEGI